METTTTTTSDPSGLNRRVIYKATVNYKYANGNVCSVEPKPGTEIDVMQDYEIIIYYANNPIVTTKATSASSGSGTTTKTTSVTGETAPTSQQTEAPASTAPSTVASTAPPATAATSATNPPPASVTQAAPPEE